MKDESKLLPKELLRDKKDFFKPVEMAQWTNLQHPHKSLGMLEFHLDSSLCKSSLVSLTKVFRSSDRIYFKKLKKKVAEADIQLYLLRST